MPEEHPVKILNAEFVTHNVRRFILERPAGYTFQPGQATEISINKAGWEQERRPFTFTGLEEWDHLEFTIKIYDDHDGVTHQLGTLQEGDELLLHEVFGTITYHGEGTFIAGGAGVTPFIAIFRRLHEDGITGKNSLIFSNRTEKDIILRDEFSTWLGDQFINTITDEKTGRFDNRKIDEAYLKEKIADFSRYFYVCGPDPMIESVTNALARLGASKDKVIIEQF